MSYYRVPSYRERAAFHREFWIALGEFFSRKGRSTRHAEDACR